jgi:hypothetical protein
VCRERAVREIEETERQRLEEEAGLRREAETAARLAEEEEARRQTDEQARLEVWRFPTAGLDWPCTAWIGCVSAPCWTGTPPQSPVQGDWLQLCTGVVH